MYFIILFYSKVTLHTDCCSALVTLPSSYKSFVHLLNRQQHKAVSNIKHFYCTVSG
jgi:hypothetical protein